MVEIENMEMEEYDFRIRLALKTPTNKNLLGGL